MSRRRVLRTTGVLAAAGLAGCPDVTVNIGDGGGDGAGGGGGDGSDGAGGGGGDGSDGDGGSVSCTDASNGYERMDVGSRPIIFDFDYPAIFDEPVYTRGGPVAIFEVDRTTAAGGSITHNVQQAITPEYSVGEVENQGINLVTTTFNGEEVDFFGTRSGNDFTMAADLPYQINGGREVLVTTFSLSVSNVESNECGDALRAAGERFAESLAVNPETTIESEVG